MITYIHSFKLNGVNAVPVTVECEISTGLGIHMVGLADLAVKESLLRTITALQSHGYRCPGKKIVINIAPADLHKTGTGYDLPIALAVIGASGQEPLPGLDDYIIAGELALDGYLREIPGCVQAAELALKEGKACILPTESAKAAAAALGDKVAIYGADDLREVIDILNDGAPEWTALDDYKSDLERDGSLGEYLKNTWDSISGMEGAKRALEIAVAGGHPILLVGAPGSGKATLAKAARDIMPAMTEEEALEVQRVYSAASKRIAPGFRPFRATHYSASLAAMLGGGGDCLPGEVPLAHNGVLYLDEFNMLPSAMREGLRAPMENGEVKISRLKNVTTYPARPFFILSTEPCPCGYYGEGDRCTCTTGQRNAFLAKLSGPIMDRITMQCWVHPNSGGSTGETCADVAERVRKARDIQMVRQNGLNDNVPAGALDVIAHLDAPCRELIDKLFYSLGLSARAYTRILKIARTIADLDGTVDIRPDHIAEAASYRFLDRGNI